MVVTRGQSPNKQRFLWSAPVAVALTFLFVGCYTVLKHPITESENPERAHQQEYYRDRCIDCHADFETYPYGFFYGDYPEYIFDYPRLGYYYAYPWWWDHYWYDGSDNGNSEETGGPSGKAGRRGELVPPYVGGWNALPTGSSQTRPAPTPTRATKSGSTSGTETASPSTSGGKTTVKKTKAAKTESSGQSAKNKKSKRRGGIKP